MKKLSMFILLAYTTTVNAQITFENHNDTFFKVVTTKTPILVGNNNLSDSALKTLLAQGQTVVDITISKHMPIPAGFLFDQNETWQIQYTSVQSVADKLPHIVKEKVYLNNIDTNMFAWSRFFITLAIALGIIVCYRTRKENELVIILGVILIFVAFIDYLLTGGPTKNFNFKLIPLLIVVCDIILCLTIILVPYFLFKKKKPNI